MCAGAVEAFFVSGSPLGAFPLARSCSCHIRVRRYLPFAFAFEVAVAVAPAAVRLLFGDGERDAYCDFVSFVGDLAEAVSVSD